MPKKIGLTGGIACGKSLVLQMFAERGFFTLSADALVTEVYKTDAEVRKAVKERFGDEAIQADGLPNRQFIASKVFSNISDIQWLESLIHPRVRVMWTGLVAAETGRVSIVEIPLLFEKKMASDFDATVCVYSSKENQLARLRERGLSEAEAEKRMASQLPVDEKVKQADFVIANNGSISLLQNQVDYFIRQIG